VINVGGVSANRYRVDKVAYSAMKAALERFTQTLAIEWAPYGVTVNAIAPGVFPDPEAASPEALQTSKERARTTVPLKRVGEMREVGLLALYLVSDASNYMTGEVIRLDGGVSQM
jgi:NAD(P)-dependent dehydrogenase (short-subunit alcohol dehydrogenase family)